MKQFLAATLLVTSTLLTAHDATAHCQIPCGIYGDDTRFTIMLEDVATLRKSVAQITEESAKDKPNYNQLVRWVKNKESHADAIKTTVLEYFLAQRIKSDTKNYHDKLVALHQIVVLSMKAKQTADTSVIDALEAEVKKFQTLFTEK